MKIEMDDYQKLLKNVEKQLEKIQTTITDNAIKTSVKTFDEAIKQTPVETGRLRSTGKVTINGKVLAKGPSYSSFAPVREGLKDGKNINMLNPNKYNIRDYHKGLLGRKHGDKVVIEFSFGTPYANIQHFDYPNKRYIPAKMYFLWDPFQKHFLSNSYKKKVMEEIRKTLRQEGFLM